MYTDEIEPLLEAEQALRLEIALRIAQEAGAPARAAPTHEELAAADEAIALWQADGEDDADLRAFRPLGPLQDLLIDHAMVCDRIADIRDRRLS
jgi:hypothetical protein